MDSSRDKTVYSTTTDEGTKVSVKVHDIPSTLKQAKEKVKDTVEEVKQSFPPSNEDIDNQLQKAKENLEKQKGDLNERGQLLANDAQGLLDTTSKALNEKNKDDKFQKLFLDSKEAVDKNLPVLQKEGEKIEQKIQKEGEKVGKKAQKEGEKIGKEIKKEGKKLAKEVEPQQLKDETVELYKYIKNLLWNFLKSEDFRVLAADWIGFFQYLGTKKIKQQVKKQEGKGGVAENIAKAVDEGLEQTSKPASKDELEDRTQEKFDQLWEKIRSKKEYQDMIRDFFRVWDQFRARLEYITEQLKEEAEEIKEKVEEVKEEVKKETKKESKKLKNSLDATSFWNAMDDAEDLIVQFTGRSEWEDFKSSAWHLYNSVVEDEELRQWFCDFRCFVTDALDNPDEYDADLFKKKSQELLQRGKEILEKDEWSDRFEEVWNEFNVLLENIKNDSTTNEFGDKLKKLAKDFAFNSKGMPDIFVMEDSLIQIKNMLIPLFKEQLAKINIARIDFVNDTYDARIEDIGFSGSFLPEHIDFRMRNDSHLDTSDSSKDYMRHILQFQVDKIKPEFKNFKFCYRRKTFPKIEDYGVADMKISGAGALIRVTWKVESRSGYPPRATLSDITCHIDRLDLHIVGEQTKHDILDKMFAPIFSKNIKNKISSSIEDYLRSKLKEVNDKVNSFFESKPTERLTEKANEALQEQYKKLQKSIDAN